MATRYKDRIKILEDAEIEELYGRGSEAEQPKDDIAIGIADTTKAR
jgi:hypothetical protein